MDIAGNQSTSTFIVKVDSVKPIIAFNTTGLSNGAWFRSATVGVDVSDVNSGVQTQIITHNGFVESAPISLSDGTHKIFVTATDNAGNVEASSYSIQVDGTPPIIVPSFMSTSGSNGWLVSMATISADVSDVLSGVTSTQYRVNDGVWQDGDSIIVGDGIQRIDFQAFDTAGNLQVASQEVHVDTIPPVYDFDSTLEGSVLSGTVTLSGNIFDVTSAVRDVEFSPDGSNWLAASFVDSRWNFDLDTSTLDNGDHSLYLRATDKAGNMGQPFGTHVILDNFAPYVNLAETWNIQESGSLDVLNNVIPLKSVRIVIQDPILRYPDRVIYYDLPAPTTVSWDRVIGPASAPPGSYTVSVEVCDIYALCSEDTGTIVIPDTPAPTPLIQLPLIEIPKWIPPIPFLPAPEPAREQPIVVQAIVMPIQEDVQLAPFPIWIIFVISAFVLSFAFLLLLDPRPAALRSLTGSLHQHIQYQKE